MGFRGWKHCFYGSGPSAPDGTFVIAGDIEKEDKSESPMSLAKFDKDGTLIWLRYYREDLGSAFYAMSPTLDKGFIMAARYGIYDQNFLNANVIVIKTDSLGNGPDPVGISEMPPYEAFYLRQNYPNPATTNTQIDYRLPKHEKGIFNIIDLTGRIVYREKVPGGKGSVVINNITLPAGIYLYQLKTSEGVVTRKMVIEPLNK